MQAAGRRLRGSLACLLAALRPWQTPPVLELLARLLAAPVRPGGILDMPFDEYVADVAFPEVAQLFEGYVRAHRRPTLRIVLADARFRQWARLDDRAPVRKKLVKELAIVCGVIAEEEHILPDAPAALAACSDGGDALALIRWAEDVGVMPRLRDPSGVLMQRVPDTDLRRVLRNVRRGTIGDLVAGTFELANGWIQEEDRVALATHARAYVTEAGETLLAARREAGRVAALGHVPPSGTARDLLSALDAALAKLDEAPSKGVALARLSFERKPVRLLARLSLVPHRSGRARAIDVSLVLEDWREAPLRSLLRSQSKEGKTGGAAALVLDAARRVILDPAHALHGPVLAYLDESPWARVLLNLEALAAENAHAPLRTETPLAWQITADRGVKIAPLALAMRAGAAESYQATTVDAIALGMSGHIAPRDEAVVSALWVPQVHGGGYSYYPRDARALAEEERGRSFRALSLLARHPRGCLRGRAGTALRIVEGELGVALAEVEDGFRIAFDVAGEPIDAPSVRAALDGRGYLLFVDEAGGRVLLAHVGARRALAIAALASEAAIFPASAAGALVSHAVALADLVPIALPVALAGEPVAADARPVVRVVRDGFAALSLTFLVRPIAGGPTFAPGEGPVRSVQQAGGRAAVTTRSLDDEMWRAAALRSLLPGDPTSLTPSFTGIEEMLAVIAVLRAAADAEEAVVEWPKTLPRVLGAPKWSKLLLRVTTQRDWFGVDGSVEIEGVQVALADLLAARRQGERFVVVGNDQLIAIEDDLRARLDDLEALGRPSKTGLTLVKAAVPALVALAASRDQLDAVPAFWTLLARIDAAAKSQPRVPARFKEVLRPYQVDGFRWMSRLAAWGAGACLADEMGLGKTVQTLALLVSRSKEGPALVVAPTSVGPNWLAEAGRFAPSLNAILHRGAGRAAALAKLGPGDLLITSYDVLARDADALRAITFATLVVDEAQAIKNGDTTRARAARSLRADFRLALTGTPVENRLSELFSLVEFLDPGLLGTEAEFRERYVVPIERDRDASRSAALARVVRPFLLRRKKSDVLTELPARTEVTRAVEPSPAERTRYEAARLLALAALSGADEDARFRMLAELMRLRRLACHPRLDDPRSKTPSSKLEAFLELVSELREGGHRALVFSQFTGHLALVEEALRAREIPYLYLDGKTPLPERTARVARFQAGEGDLFLISLKAGGTGLNLTAADTVIHLDPWWNPAVEDQASDRVHRIGQTRPVTVIRLVAQGTIEEAVMALHANKRQLAESILEGSAASGKLSIAELAALVREGAGLAALD